MSEKIETEAFRRCAKTEIRGGDRLDPRRPDGSQVEPVERTERHRWFMFLAGGEGFMRCVFHILTLRDFEKTAFAAMFPEGSVKGFGLPRRDLPPLLFRCQRIKQLHTVEETDRHLFCSLA